MKRALVMLGDMTIDALIAELEPAYEAPYKALVMETLGDIGPKARRAIHHIEKYLGMQRYYSEVAKKAIKEIERPVPEIGRESDAQE